MPNPGSFDEAALRQVLARAVEIERERGSALTEAQVREIARELSIPDSAIEQALAEYGNQSAVAVASSRRLPGWRSTAALAAFVGLGILAYLLVSVTVRIFPASAP
jgi:hypothetical protein